MWTISYNGTEKSLEDWGLDNLVRTRQNLGIDTVQFVADGRAVDADEIFPYGATVIMHRNRVVNGNAFEGGKRWFYGRIEPWRRIGAGRREVQTGACVGPMWYLHNRVFRQSVKSFTGFSDPNDPTSPQLFETKTFSHLFLNQSLDLVAHPDGKLNWREQVIEILQWAISCGDPVTIGDITPAFAVPIEEVKNITCTEALRKLYRWCLDATFWFDYTAVPYPRLHCKRLSELLPVSINLNAGRPLETIQITERQDWKRPYVLLQFEQEVNGALQVIDDVWPNPIPAGPPPGGLETTVDLKGWTTQRLSQRVQSADYNINDLTWWKSKQRQLADTKTIKTVTLLTDAPYAPFLQRRDNAQDINAPVGRELVQGRGQIADWMTGIYAQQARAGAYVDIEYTNGAKKRRHFIHHDLVLTNAISQVYTLNQVTQVGDPVPVGLAKEIWTSLQALSCEGSVQLTDREVPEVLDFGNAVNFITPARPAWANINALIQQITESAVDGKCTIQFGAPDHLNANDLVGLLRVARQRFNPSPLNLRNGNTGGGGTAALPDKGGDNNSTSGGGLYQKHMVSAEPDDQERFYAGGIDVTGAHPVLTLGRFAANGALMEDGTTRSIVLNPGELDAGKKMMVRPCQLSVNGQLKTVYVACTDAFTASGGGTKWCKVKTVAGDYLICREWDGSQEGNADIYVAKRPENRQSLVTETIDDIIITYTYNGANERVARDQYNTVQTEVLYRRYVIGELIWAAEAATGLKVTVQGVQKDITYVESVNRIWLRKYLT